MSDNYRNQDDVFGESVDSTGHSMSGYYNLIYKMCRITATEYRQALRVLHNYPNNEYAQHQVYHCERYLRENKYGLHLNGDLIIEKIKNEVTEEMGGNEKLQVEVYEMYTAKGMSMSDIARKLNIKLCKVQSVLRKSNIILQ